MTGRIRPDFVFRFFTRGQVRVVALCIRNAAYHASVAEAERKRGGLGGRAEHRVAACNRNRASDNIRQRGKQGRGRGRHEEEGKLGGRVVRERDGGCGEGGSEKHRSRTAALPLPSASRQREQSRTAETTSETDTQGKNSSQTQQQ
jgi:hypothetical protein